MTTPNPSPGAMKAAEALKEAYAIEMWVQLDGAPKVEPPTPYNVAQIIDQHTGTKELVEALEKLYDYQQRISSPDTRWELPIYQEARAILAKHKEKP